MQGLELLDPVGDNVMLAAVSVFKELACISEGKIKMFPTVLGMANIREQQ